MSDARHIDQTARMIWLTLRKGGYWSVAEIVHHWRPTFTEAEVLDALKRLQANACVRRIGTLCGRGKWSTVGCQPAPGLELAPAHRVAA